MHEAVALGALEDLIGLLLGDETVRAQLGVVDRVVVEVDAHVLLEMAAALAHETAGTAAGARADGDRPRVFHETVHLVIRRLAGVVLDGGLYVVALLAVGHDALHDAGHPDGIEIIGLAVADARADGAGFLLERGGS